METEVGYTEKFDIHQYELNKQMDCQENSKLNLPVRLFCRVCREDIAAKCHALEKGTLPTYHAETYWKSEALPNKLNVYS